MVQKKPLSEGERRRSKTRARKKAGEHKPIEPTEMIVYVPATDRTPSYNAHIYECKKCGERNTRRTLRKIPCKKSAATAGA